MLKVNLDPIVQISPSSQDAGVGARTRDRKVHTTFGQIRYSPGLATELVITINDVRSTAKSIVFALMHSAQPNQPAYDCEDQLNNEGASFYS
ncbi:hypothetical protein PoB_002331400 [Plakobranchus ocellatus]|uniref:Uncharacterized protein n=1 Tax=Plakobranchus ocellatus TaxID=259542 RepID=A0AAV3ZNC8_9GAST|nr:hypothetical protein PoB_002331400 [Plakobranchus ocellatus]